MNKQFRNIPQKYGNSVKTDKFRSSSWNSVSHGKLWALAITDLHHAITQTILWLGMEINICPAHVRLLHRCGDSCDERKQLQEILSQHLFFHPVLSDCCLSVCLSCPVLSCLLAPLQLWRALIFSQVCLSVCLSVCVSDRHFYPSTLTDFNETSSQGPYFDLVWLRP